MERKRPYLGVISGVLLLLAVATPFIAPFVMPTVPPHPEQPSAQQYSEAWGWLGVIILALLVIIAFGVLATLFAIAALIRREKYPLLPILVILVGGGGSAYLIVSFFVH